MKKKKKSRTSPKTVLILTAVMLVPMVFFGFYLREILQEPRVSQKPQFFYGSGIEEDLIEEDPEPFVETVERRPLAISGIVFDFARKPRVGVDVVVGDEIVKTDAEGRFSFESRVRPFVQPLRVLSGERECASFAAFVTGDWSPEPVPGPGASANGPRVPFEDEIPRQPQRLRWTIHLHSETDLPPRGLARPPEGEDDPAALPAAKSRGEFDIVMDAAIREDWGIGGRIHAQGRTNLPDEASVYVQLKFAGFPAAAALEPAVVTRGRWSTFAVCGSEVETYSGDFVLTSSFNPVNEDPNSFEKWREDFPGVDFFKIAEITETRDVFFGEAVEAREEDLEAEAFIAKALAEAHRSHDALMSRINQIKALGRGWDPTLLETRREALTGWFQDRLIEPKEGLLHEPVWRRFLDVDWRPRVESLLGEHRARGVGKYREAYDRLDQLLTSILQMSRVYSMFVIYPLFQMPVHQSDFYFDERGQHDLLLLERIVAEQFEILEFFTRITKGGLRELTQLRKEAQEG